MPDYHIERAKSSRGACKKCKEKIEKNELRIAITTMRDDIAMSAYQHPACFTVPRNLKVDAATFVEEYLADQTTDSIMSDESKKEEIIQAIASKKETKTEENAVTKKINSYKHALATLGEDDEDDEDARPKKKAKKGSEVEVAARALRIYESMKNDELKDVLRWNLGYGMSGTKDVLLLRCIDGHVHGRLARCPTCFKGRLQLKDDDAGATVVCGGYFDEEHSIRVSCNYTVKNDKAPRLQPWYDEQPTEEEVEEMKKITEEHAAAGGGGSSDVPSELMKRAEELEWPDTSGMQGKKEAAKLMVELCTSGEVVVDLPEDKKKATMGVGKIIVGNPDEASSASEILKLVVKEFGIVSKKNELAEQQKGAIATSCACAANAGVMQAFLELKGLYLKEGNANASNAYSKAAAAIMEIPFEITEDNAKGLAKGKTKVANIGKGSADKIFEFVTTGTIQKLEEKRLTVS